MNIHISEVVSEIIEPVVETFVGGLEIISTEDMLAHIDELNEKNENWTPGGWWETMDDEHYKACGKCLGDEKYM